MGAKDSKLGEKMAQRKERVEELLPEQLVPNGRVRSGFLRANAQKNRAKSANRGHSSKTNLPSFSVCNKVLMSL